MFLVFEGLRQDWEHCLLKIFKKFSLCLVVCVGCKSADVKSDGESEAFADSSKGSPSPTVPTPTIDENKILDAMRLNRQTFQEKKVLSRYGESLTAATHPSIVACGLPRTSKGEPAVQFPSSDAHDTARFYDETEVAKCVTTKGGLAGKRPEPLVQHYYCTLPGFSPDIRSCFTFQLRLDPQRSAVDDVGFFKGSGTVPIKLDKTWKFAGTNPTVLPDFGPVFKYCAEDGRPDSVVNKISGQKVPLKNAYPEPTKPMCWVAATQADVFKEVMGGIFKIPVKKQVALLEDYYDCKKIKAKVSATRYAALCEYDLSQWP